MRRLALLGVLLFLGLRTMAGAPAYSNEFLELPRGARAFCFGEAAIVAPDQAFSVGGNAALLTQASAPHHAGLMHVNYFQGLASSDLAAYANRLDSCSLFGVSLYRYGVDQIPNTTDLIDESGNFDYDRLSYFSTADYAFHLSYARSLDHKSSWGVNLKFIYRKVGFFASAIGLGWDAGYFHRGDRWSYAFFLSDATSTYTTWSYNAEALSIPDYVLPSGDTIRNSVPTGRSEVKLPVLRAAVSYPLHISEQFDLLALAGLKMSTDGARNSLFRMNRFSFDPSIAAELSYDASVFLRLGCSNFQKIAKTSGGSYWSVEPSVGLGLRFSSFQIDYTIANPGSMGLARYSHIFSLKYSWGK